MADSKAREILLPSGEGFPMRGFRLEWFSANPTICMIAKRGSGKSVLCQKIMEHYSYLPGGVVISRTDKMNSFYCKFFPDLYIHYEYTSELLDRVLTRQENMIDKCIAKYREGKKVDPRAFLIMDDCLASKGTWANDKPILEVFYNGRHYQLLFILTMQSPLGIKPELRQNFDYVFLLATDFYNQQKKLFDHYAGMFPSFELFRQVFVQVTSNYGAMVIVNGATISNNIMNKVFYYRVDKLENKKIGCKQFRDYHENNYNTNWQTELRTKFDVEKYANQGKKHKQVVVNRIS
jgi:hypothetical protein